MDMKVVVAILLIAAVPVCAQAQSSSVPRVSKDDAQKVVTIISSDKAKTQTYCDIRKLGDQIGQAYEKRDFKLVDELFDKIETLEKTSVLNMPHWSKDLSNSIKNDKFGAEIILEFTALNMLCTR